MTLDRADSGKVPISFDFYDRFTVRDAVRDQMVACDIRKYKYLVFVLVPGTQS